jgi:hypothetical protein
MTASPFTARDDRFHFDQMSDRWWETETCWFSFCHPERRLGGWIYVMARPNIGTVAGGAWVWDDAAHLPWEVLYSANYTAMRLPRDQDLDDITLPTGVSIRVLEPLTSYQLGYTDPGRFEASLRFDAVMPPHALTNTNSSFLHLNHFDQIGRVTGEILLHGERIAIDCLAMRDRSWGPRPEHRPRRNAYETGMASAQSGFLAVTNTTLAGDDIAHGFLLRDGVVRNLVAGQRRVERDPEHGWTTRLVVTGCDESGRGFEAVGSPVSRIVINRHTFIDINSLVRWTLDTGETAWGEDQDMTPVHAWSAWRRDGVWR